MPKEFKLEDPGEGIHEAEILDLEVSEGDRVEDGQILLTVETDKAAVEIPSPFTGVVEEIAVQEGERVRVGDVLMKYTPDEDQDEDEEKDGRKEKHGGEEEEGEEQGRGDEGDGEGEEEGAEREVQKKEAEKRDEGEEAKTGESRSPDRPVPAAPATRRLARELDVDLHRVEGSGPGGRVTREDVEAFAEEGEAPEEPEEGEEEAAPGEEAAREEELAPEEEPAPEEEAASREAGAPSLKGAELPDFGQWGEVERIPFRSVRRTIGERMARSWERIPHVTHMDVADVTELERVRQEHRADVEERGGRLTLTVMVMKAAVSALKEYPRFNASLDVDAEEIVLKRHFHFGVAIDTDRGLLVPVIRDVDRKSVQELAVELTELAERTRDGEVKPAEMRGATFTITNPGPIGGTGFTPLVNWPQVAILGMGRARLEPVARGDLDEHEIVPRLRLPLCLGFDHRVNDGADAARFVKHLTETLADPDSFLLSV